MELKPVFCRTRNVRYFEDLMSGLDRASGEGRLGLVYGQAGRGKTRTVQWWHANNGKSIYLRALTVWRSSARSFCQALLRELGSAHIPYRADAAFNACVEILRESRSPVFIDEIEKLPPLFLEIVRDLTDLTGAPFVLIGEEELLGFITAPQRRRAWSRTLEALQFEALSPAEIIAYAREATGGVAVLGAESAAILHAASKGDMRVTRRDLGAAIRFASTKKTTEITPDIVRAAVKMSARGRGE